MEDSFKMMVRDTTMYFYLVFVLGMVQADFSQYRPLPTLPSSIWTRSTISPNLLRSVNFTAARPNVCKENPFQFRLEVSEIGNERPPNLYLQWFNDIDILPDAILNRFQYWVSLYDIPAEWTKAIYEGRFQSYGLPTSAKVSDMFLYMMGDSESRIRSVLATNLRVAIWPDLRDFLLYFSPISSGDFHFYEFVLGEKKMMSLLDSDSKIDELIFLATRVTLPGRIRPPPLESQKLFLDGIRKTMSYKRYVTGNVVQGDYLNCSISFEEYLEEKIPQHVGDCLADALADDDKRWQMSEEIIDYIRDKFRAGKRICPKILPNPAQLVRNFQRG